MHKGIKIGVEFPPERHFPSTYIAPVGVASSVPGMRRPQPPRSRFVPFERTLASCVSLGLQGAIGGLELINLAAQRGAVALDHLEKASLCVPELRLEGLPAARREPRTRARGHVAVGTRARGHVAVGTA